MLLDTHIWIRWLNNADSTRKILPNSLIQHIEYTDTLAISAISCWELTQLIKRKRIYMSLPIQQWIDISIENGLEILPINTEIAILAGNLPEHHRDPADRFIIATSIVYQMPLISLDAKFPLYQEIQNLLIQQ